MKYFFRKLYMMRLVFHTSKGDKNRRKEAEMAILYIFRHPRKMFFREKGTHTNRSVEKNIRFILSAPYNDEIYAHFRY